MGLTNEPVRVVFYLSLGEFGGEWPLDGVFQSFVGVVIEMLAGLVNCIRVELVHFEVQQLRVVQEWRISILRNNMRKKEEHS